ncbi:MAG: hypothetical protein QW505_05450 [Thermoplasmata archaeon]
MAERWMCFYCGRVHDTKEKAIKCHNAHVQPIAKHPNPPKIRWWAGR